MKQIIDLRPVYHRLEERIRSHVVLCWLALLLIRIIETQAYPNGPYRSSGSVTNPPLQELERALRYDPVDLL